MSIIELTLDDEQTAAIREMSQATGKSPEKLLHEGLELRAERARLDRRRERFAHAFGIWRDRDDLPDFAALRRELDRTWPERVDP